VNVLELRPCVQSVGYVSVGYVDIFIDGRLLVDAVREIEIGYDREIAGLYMGLPFDVVMPPSRHLLGEPAAWYGDDGRSALLVCDCSEPDCWSLQTSIEVGADEIRWASITQPHRPPWRYDQLGPLRFQREQYEAELRRLGAARTFTTNGWPV
jgi:hypothetical protein